VSRRLTALGELAGRAGKAGEADGPGRQDWSGGLGRHRIRALVCMRADQRAGERARHAGLTHVPPDVRARRWAGWAGAAGQAGYTRRHRMLAQSGDDRSSRVACGARTCAIPIDDMAVDWLG